MSSELFDVLSERAADLVRTLRADLQSAGTPHYAPMDPRILHERCHRLVETFLASASGNPAPFVRYVRGMTEERISEGYYLREIQQALSILESRAWQVTVERSSIGTLVRNLAVVTGTIGAAKDELARVFLEHKQRADDALARLQTSRLFAGTEGHVEAQGDHPGLH